MNDNELAELYLEQYVHKNDASSLGSLYDLLAKSVFYFVLSINHHEEDARDIVQDTFVIVASKASQYKRGTSVRNWVFEIARNLTLAKIKKDKREISFEEADPYGILGSYEMEDKSTPMLDLAQSLLPRDEYQILQLHIIHELRHREIAKRLNLPLGTVTWKYKRAIDRLRGEISKGGKR